MSSQTWTVEKVIEEAAKKPGWFVNPGGGEIWRRTGKRPGTVLDLECPVCAAAGGIRGLGFRMAAVDVGMPKGLALRIACASDNAVGCEPIIRQKLLSAFGLLPAGKNGAK